MMRLSALRNMPVVCEGRQLGLLQGICLHEDQRRLCGVIASCGFHGKRVIPAEEISAITDGFILARKAQKYKRSFEKPLCMFVRDTSGLLAGRITDYAIDERTLRVTAIEMASGYLPKEWRRRIWIYAFACATPTSLEVTIPSGFLCGPTLSGEGIEECVCLP